MDFNLIAGEFIKDAFLSNPIKTILIAVTAPIWIIPLIIILSRE